MSIQALDTTTAGSRKRLFGLAFRSSLLTVVTLGIYRFWMKTRLRRFYWSAIRPGGVPLEYTGTGVEKLMGFLVAVVVMAFYIGVFNLILMFVSFSLLNDNFAAYAMSFVGVIPIYFYARYRARRYILARTRWRGIRFGIEPAAWAYAWRAMLHWLATLATLGLLLPRQIFWLEKFRVDRTWFGTARFQQNGNWKMLLPIAWPYYLGILSSLILIGLGFANPLWLFGLVPSVAIAGFGLIHLSVQSFRVLGAAKRLDGNIAFRAAPSTWRVLRIYLFGNLFAGFILAIGAAITVFLFFVFAALLSPDLTGTGPVAQVAQSLTDFTQAGLIALGILGYFSFFIFWGVLGQIFVTLPLLHHYAETLMIENSHLLTRIQQRDRDAFSEAEGFAEALDIGAAI